MHLEVGVAAISALRCLCNFSSETANWDAWVEDALSKMESQKQLLSPRPINLGNSASKSDVLEVFEGLRQWDRTTVHVRISELTYHKWLNDIPSCGETAIDEASGEATEVDLNSRPDRMLLLFSGDDFLGLSSHPAIRMAAAKAAQEYGMGPRGSAVNCGYTDFHWLLEARLAALKKKEDCLLCPTGFAANMALMVAIGSVASLLASTKRPSRAEKVAVFSDALNNPSIVDGLLLADRQNCVEVFVYRHCDMQHLDTLLSECTMEKKVVVTDSIFSMDGDFAPIDKLAKLRKKHGFLLAIDDANGTFVCGKHGGGVAEVFNCEKDVDICIGSLSKGAGCFGGFIACSKRLKQLIQARGRSFIFSTSLPVPVIAAAYAAVIVAEKEMWRRRALWERVVDFRNFTGIPITSYITSLVVGTEERTLLASRHLLQSGFRVTPIRPPAVPPNSCRLRVALSAAHTRDDIKKLANALSQYINFDDSCSLHTSELHAKL